MYKGLNEMNMEELICTDGGGVGWLAVAGAVVTIGTLVSWGYEVYEGWKDYLCLRRGGPRD